MPRTSSRIAGSRFSGGLSKVEDSASAVQTGTSDVNRKALSFAEEQVDAAFKFAQEMVRAKDLEELMALQQNYLRRQMETLGEQARDISDTASKVAQDAAKSVKS